MMVDVLCLLRACACFVSGDGTAFAQPTKRSHFVFLCLSLPLLMHLEITGL